MHKKKNILFLGGGIASITACIQLAKTNKYNIHFLSEREEYFPREIYSAAFMLSDQQEKREVKGEDVVLDFAVKYSDIFKEINSVNVYRGDITYIDLRHRIVKAGESVELKYDYLVINTSHPLYKDREPKEYLKYARVLMSGAEALRSRAKMKTMLRSLPKHRNYVVTVIGGGVAGIELAAAISLYIRNMSEVVGHPINNMRCNLVTNTKSLIENMTLGKSLLRELVKTGVKIIFDEEVKRIDENVLELKNNIKHNHDEFIRPADSNTISSDILREFDIIEKDNIAVDEYLRYETNKRVFIIGYKYGSEFDENMKHKGEYIADNIEKSIQLKKIKPFKQKAGSKSILYGKKKAIFIYHNFEVKGHLGWTLKMISMYKMFRSILSSSKSAKLVKNIAKHI